LLPTWIGFDEVLGFELSAGGVDRPDFIHPPTLAAMSSSSRSRRPAGLSARPPTRGVGRRLPNAAEAKQTGGGSRCRRSPQESRRYGEEREAVA
jgi:hypothetical protein